MNIELKLVPSFSDENYFLDQQCLKIPVLFTYEDVDRSFVFNITNGLNIVGKISHETNYICYFIGDTCSIEQLSAFTNNLAKGNPCQITFGEDGGSIDCIEYNPLTSTWTHKTDSRETHTGGTLTLKLSPETLKKFVHSLEMYRRLACMQIEGHKRLWEMDQANILSDQTL